METRKTTPGPAKGFFDRLAAEAEAAPPETLADVAGTIAGTGIVTDPIITAEQTVVVGRADYDRLVAALAGETGPLADAARDLIAAAIVGDEAVDFPVPAFAAFDDAESVARIGMTQEQRIDAILRGEDVP